MSNPESLEIVFRALYGGFVVGRSRAESELTLVVDCQYLAELIRPDLIRFRLELNGIYRLELNCWTMDGSTLILKEDTDIFTGSLDILGQLRNTITLSSAARNPIRTLAIAADLWRAIAR